MRTEAGFSVAALAERAGISIDYLRLLEEGLLAPPRGKSLTGLARALRLPLELLKELAQSARPALAKHVEPIRHFYRAGLTRNRVSAPTEWVPTDRSRRPVMLAPLRSLLSAERIILGASCASLEDAVTRAASVVAPDPQRLADAILRREAESSSALGAGVAVPHALIPQPFSTAVMMTLCPRLAVPAPDGLPLRVLIVLVLDASVAHTRTLAHVARLAVPEVTDALCRAKTREDVLALVGRIAA